MLNWDLPLKKVPCSGSVREIGLDLMSAVRFMNRMQRLKVRTYHVSAMQVGKCHLVSSIRHNEQKLTSFDGDSVGTAVGLDEGETDGPFDGDAEGPVLGDDVGGSEGETV